MSVQTITGMREYNFKDEVTGREVSGMSVYYKEPLETKDGFYAAGFTIGKLSVKPGTKLYEKMLNADYSEPFEAEVTFDILPGSKKPALANIE